MLDPELFKLTCIIALENPEIPGMVVLKVPDRLLVLRSQGRHDLCVLRSLDSHVLLPLQSLGSRIVLVLHFLGLPA